MDCFSKLIDLDKAQIIPYFKPLNEGNIVKISLKKYILPIQIAVQNVYGG